MFNYNVLVLVHIEGDITINDMRAIDAYAIETNETAQELHKRLDEESYEKYRNVTDRCVTIYLQPYSR